MKPRLIALVGAMTALVAGATSGAASPSPSPLTPALTWEKWQHLPGIFDLGLQRDGAGLVAEGTELFFTVDRAGSKTPINTPSSFHDVAGYEAYFAVSAGEPLGGACPFQRGAIYVLDPRSKQQVLEVDANSGAPRLFATVPGVSLLNGIVFDDTGSFGDHPLLVTGPSGSQSILAAIDCHGSVHVVSATAPRMEGGFSVAPATFGSHGGELIAVDEIAGDIIGIKPSGAMSVVAKLGQPVGQDLGVESTGFVPRDFLKNGGGAYLADRATANNPHPGTDSILRLTSAELAGAGVHEGDLLVATEGGGLTVDVACAATCSLRPIAAGPAAGHIEGHVIFLVNQAGQAPPAETPPSPHPRPTPSPVPAPRNTTAVGFGIAGVGLLLVLVAVGLLVRRARAN